MPKQKRRPEIRYRPTPVTPRYESTTERTGELPRRGDDAPRLGPYEFRYPVDLGYAIQTRTG